MAERAQKLFRSIQGTQNLHFEVGSALMTTFVKFGRNSLKDVAESYDHVYVTQNFHFSIRNVLYRSGTSVFFTPINRCIYTYYQKKILKQIWEI